MPTVRLLDALMREVAAFLIVFSCAALSRRQLFIIGAQAPQRLYLIWCVVLFAYKASPAAWEIGLFFIHFIGWAGAQDAPEKITSYGNNDAVG